MRRGAAWEFELERWHARYCSRQVAWVVKTEPATKLWEGRLLYESKGPPDFVGVLKGGRGVVFDAKHVPRFTFSCLEDHQGRDLELAHRLGALSFVAVRSGESRYVLPWATITDRYWRWRDGERRISVAESDRITMDDTGWYSWAEGQ